VESGFSITRYVKTKSHSTGGSDFPPYDLSRSSNHKDRQLYTALGAANPVSAEGTRSCATRHPAAIAGHVPPGIRTAQKDRYHDHSRNSEAAERGIHVAFVIDAFEAGIERL
tara:strand:- start:267 stop:602 length:336 start_codon:yes stop_codon:yes gene_type:complete